MGTPTSGAKPTGLEAEVAEHLTGTFSQMKNAPGMRKTCFIHSNHDFTVQVRVYKLSEYRKTVAHPRTVPKLTKDQVAEIRSSSETGAALAKRFGVSNGSISRVRNYHSYPKMEG